MQHDFIWALLKEIKLQQTFLAEPVSTIYFGGGTPSILPSNNIEDILRCIYETFKVIPNAEVSLEANPDDISLTKLKEWKSIGITRLSIGIQSFFEDDLKWMNRAHNATQANECIILAQEAGFENLTIDLIYGSPALSDEHWEQNIEKAIELKITHLSCYALTVEPKTALEKLIQQKKLANVESEKQARQFELLMQWMDQADYEHYEISNFARTGFRSKHNSSYWQGKPYLGLGPSAHSFNINSRRWNISNNALYIKSLQKGIVPFEIETLTIVQQLNEYTMTSLRTMEGLSLQKVEKEFGQETTHLLLKAAEPHLQHDHLKKLNNFLQITNQGKLFADRIAADLFLS